MMTITLLLVGAACAAAMGIYEAYSRKRGVFGWIVSLAASVIGGVGLGMSLPMVVIPLAGNLSGSASLYLGLACVIAGVLIGSAVLLKIVNKFRS